MNIPTILPGLRPTTLAVALCLSLATGAYAETGAKPCAEDASRLCQDVQPGQGRIALCLKEHKDELSPACKQNIEKAKARIRKAAEDCRDDMQKHCKDVQPGEGRIAQCLKQHEPELTPDCKEHLARPKDRK